MGFAAKKGKLVEVDLTTEIGQDGMLFISNIISSVFSLVYNTISSQITPIHSIIRYID